MQLKQHLWENLQPKLLQLEKEERTALLSNKLKIREQNKFKVQSGKILKIAAGIMKSKANTQHRGSQEKRAYRKE